jgi:hypothetical protein
MNIAGVEGRKTTHRLEEHKLYIAEAMNTFFDKKLLERVGFADREDLVKVPPGESQPKHLVQETPQEQPAVDDVRIVTTDAEMEVYNYVRQRLPFLIAHDDDLYRKLESIYFKDFQGNFAISYKQDRKGRLCNFHKGTESKYRFDFPESGETVTTDTLSDIDEKLLAIFMRRVEELG